MKQISLFIILFFGIKNLHSQSIGLVSPLNNFVTEKDSLLFIWNKHSENSSLYQLTISDDISFLNNLIDTTINQNQISLNLNAHKNKHIYWKVTELNSNIQSNTNTFFIIDLPNYNNIAIHLISDSVVLSGNNVVEWKNIADPSFTFIQNTSNRRPSFQTNQLNGHSAISFIPGKEFQGNKNILSNVGIHYFVVATPASTNTSVPFLFDQGSATSKGSGLLVYSNRIGTYMPASHGGGPQRNFFTTNLPSSIIGRTIDFTNQNQKVTLNNLIDSTITHTVSNYQNPKINLSFKLKIGGQAKSYNSTRSYTGKLYEIIALKDTAFQNDKDRNIIPNYLHHKYSPYPNLGEDKINTYSLCDTEYTFSIGSHYNSQTWNNNSSDTFLYVNTSGTYTVQVSDVFGYALADTVFVKFPFTKFNDTTLVCVGDTAILYKGLGENYMFNWSNGSSDSIQYITNSGLYSVTVTDTFGCSISDQTYVLIDSFSFNPSLGPDRIFCLNSNLNLENVSPKVLPINYTWSTGETSTSITLSYPSDTSISIFAVDRYGCPFRDTVQAYINNVEAPNVDFISDTTCFGSASLLTSTSTPSGSDVINGYTWTFPDNSTGSNQTNNSYTHPLKTNSFSVKLTVNTDSSCSNSIEKQVFLRKLPQPNFSNEVVCANVDFHLQDLTTYVGTDSIVTWQWSYNANNVSTDQNPSLIINNEGLNDVKLTVTDIFNCTDSITKQIEVFPALLSDFSFENTCLGDSVSFTDQTASFSTILWDWDFNGQGISTAQNPKFVFNAVGNQQISLSIENAIGCKSDTTKSIYISPKPIAKFEFDKACMNDTSLFYTTSTFLSNQDSLVSFTWQIDSFSYENDSAQHLFDSQATAIVQFEVESYNGCKDDTTQIVTIHPNPIVDFDFDPKYGTAPLEVNFINTSSGATNYAWTFGDSIGLSILENPQYIYTQNGIYNVSLIASNTFNCNTKAEKQISVVPSELDIELKNLSFNIQTNPDNSISINPKVQLRNVGSRLIENTDLVLKLNSENKFVQQWQDSLDVGNILEYTFDAYYLVSDLQTSKYICVEAINVNDGTENNFTNNKVCSILDGFVQFSNPYPNPADNKVFLDIITKSKGNCAIEIFNVSGKKMNEVQNISLLEGYNQIQIATSTYQSGKYILVIKYLDESYQKSFVIK